MALKNARAKGARLELEIVKLFQSLGWKACCTSRSESRRTDDLGIDCCYTEPFLIQAKSVERLGAYHPILAKMPQIKGKFNLVFHKKSRSGTVVSMKQEDFVELLKMLIKSGQIKPE